jgi:hypothetical protein
MGRSQREKGRRGEVRARDLLREVYPDAYRSCNQAGADACCDVEGTPWFVEAKEGKTHRIWAAVRQAVEARETAKDDRPIVVISHRTRGMTLAVVPIDDYKELGDHRFLSVKFKIAAHWETLVKKAGGPLKIRKRDERHTAVVVMRAADFVGLLKR